MEENKCKECEYWNECEIKICLHNPLTAEDTYDFSNGGEIEGFKIKKGQRIAQISLVEHKGYLFGIKSEGKRTGGFGSSDAK